ncbi:hypothetical protein C7S15_1684 [Burkholderia cepacia]|nr:hypothetical protein [Burkholderia cepacia]
MDLCRVSQATVSQMLIRTGNSFNIKIGSVSFCYIWIGR